MVRPLVLAVLVPLAAASLASAQAPPDLLVKEGVTVKLAEHTVWTRSPRRTRRRVLVRPMLRLSRALRVEAFLNDRSTTE
jgi:hypothetical protein